MGLVWFFCPDVCFSNKRSLGIDQIQSSRVYLSTFLSFQDCVYEMFREVTVLQSFFLLSLRLRNVTPPDIQPEPMCK